MRTGKNRHRDANERLRLAEPTGNSRLPEEFTGLADSGEFPEWQPGIVSDTRMPQSKLINEGGGSRTFALVLKGGEVVASLQRFAAEQRLRASHFTAIGAFNDVILGFFDPGEKRYIETAITEQVEVLSLIGDITVEGNTHYIHAHVVVGKADGTAHGGRLIKAHVSPTLELILVESPKHLERRLDRETGLALITLDVA